MPENEEPPKQEIVQVEAEREKPEHEQAGALDVYDNAVARAKLVNQLIPSLLKCCHTRDISDFGGKPFVGDSGCEKIARVAGISFTKPEITAGYQEDDDGIRHYSVTLRGEASILGQLVYEVGGCDDCDKFISSRKLGFTAKKLEIEKKAYANWRGRCVRTLLGLSGLTWEDLERHGVKREGRAKVEFADGKYTADKAATPEEESKVEEVKVKIRDQILKDCSGKTDAAKEALEDITSFMGKDGKKHAGVGSVNEQRFSDKWAFRTWANIRPDGKERERYNEIILNIEAKYANKGQPSQAPTASNAAPDEGI